MKSEKNYNLIKSEWWLCQRNKQIAALSPKGCKGYGNTNALTPFWHQSSEIQVMSEVLVLSDRPVTSVIINIDDSIVEMTDSNASVNCTMTMKEMHEACQIVSMNTKTLSTSTFGLGLLIGMSAWSRREGIIFLHISRNSTINNSFTF